MVGLDFPKAYFSVNALRHPSESDTATEFTTMLRNQRSRSTAGGNNYAPHLALRGEASRNGKSITVPTGERMIWLQVDSHTVDLDGKKKKVRIYPKHARDQGKARMINNGINRIAAIFTKAATRIVRSDYLSKGGETNVRLGCNVSYNRVDSSSIWIWRNCRGIGRNCEVVIRFVPGDMCGLFLSGLEGRKKSSITIVALESRNWYARMRIASPGTPPVLPDSGFAKGLLWPLSQSAQSFSPRCLYCGLTAFPKDRHTRAHA